MSNHLLADLGVSIDAMAPALLALQRDIHAHPELSRGEVRTTARVEALLRAAGVALRALPV
ncbi:MAG: amidohydrolase, partial [Pedococcus sp.]